MFAAAGRLLPGLVVRVAVLALLGAGLVMIRPPVAVAATPIVNCPNGLSVCYDTSAVTLVQPDAQNANVRPTPAQYAALATLEGLAVDAVLARHGLANTPAERTRLLLWARAELRAELFALLVAASKKAPAARSAAEVGGLSWLGDVQRRKNFAIAQAAIDEYVEFYGNTAFTGGGRFPQNACTYQAPEPFQTAYPGGPTWIGCVRGGRPGPFDLGPRIPSVEEFTQWGTSNVERTSLTGEGVLLQTEAAALLIGLAAAAGVVGATVGAISALPLGVYLALGSAMLAYGFSKGAATVAFAAAVAGTAAASESAAAAGVAGSVVAGTSLTAVSVVGIVLAVVVAVALSVMAIIQVVTAGQVGDKLLEARTKALTTPVDGATLFNDANGMRTALHAVQSVSLSPILDDVVNAPQPTQDGAVVLRISRPDVPDSAVRTSTLRALALGPQDIYTVFERELRGGWWVDPTSNPAAAASARRDPVQGFVAPLWDENPNIRADGLRTERTGFSYDAYVSTIMVSGRLTWRATVLGREGFPKNGSTCTDYDRDGCLITDKLPFLDPAAGRARYAELVPNTAPDFTISASNGNPAQGQQITLSATAVGGGGALTTDAEGDAVTVTWYSTGGLCLSGECPFGSGPSASLTLSEPGTYTVIGTVRDAFGRTSRRTLTITPVDQPPVLTIDQASLSGTRGVPVVITGRAPDGVFVPVSITITWGDGTSSVVPQTIGFSADHLYAARGTYTVTVRATGGGLTSAPQQRTATIGNDTPVVSVTESTKIPLSWEEIEPGTTVSVGGTVTDADAGQALTLRATWYDGASELITIPRGDGRTTQSFTVRRVVRQELPFAGPVVTLTAIDAENEASQPKSVVGKVKDVAPTLSNLTITEGGVNNPTTITGFVTEANGRQSPVLGVLWGDGTNTPQEVANYGQRFFPDANGAFRATHTYTTDGTYTATIITSDAEFGGFRKIFRQDVTIVVRGLAPAIASPGWVEPPTQGGGSVLRVPVVADRAGTVTVVVPLRFGPGVPPLEITKDFPAGESVLDFPVGFQFRGVYDVKVYVRVPNTLDRVVDVPTDVRNIPPTLAEVPAQTAVEGQEVSIPLTWDDGAGLQAYSVVVDWGDGVRQNLSPAQIGGRSLTAKHTYADAGVYPVTFQVNDGGDTDTVSTEIEVSNTAPTQGAATVTAAPEGSPTVLSVPVTDAGGGFTRLRVDWGDGTTTETDPSSAAGPRTASHAYADNGTYAISVVGVDASDAQTAAQSASAVVGNARPAVSVSAPATVSEGSAVDVTFTVSDPGAADSGTLTVDWGDGTSTTGVAWTVENRTITVPHVYADDNPTGTSRDPRTIRATATDDDRGVRSGSKALVVRNVAPSVRVTVATATDRPIDTTRPIPVGAAVSVGIAVVDPGTDTHTARVTWGDGTTSDLVADGGALDATHVYTRTGTFRFRVDVTDDDLGSGRGGGRDVVVVTQRAAATAAARALRNVAGSLALTPAARTALRAAAAAVTGPAAGGAPVMVTELDAGRPASALAAARTAMAQLDVAAAAGLTSQALLRAGDLAVVARAVAQTTVDAAGVAAEAMPEGEDQALAVQKVAGARALLDQADAALATGERTAALTRCQEAVDLLS